MKKADLQLVLEGMGVQRWHTEPYVLKRETVGEHTARMLGIVCFMFEDKPPVELVLAVLHHDVPERITGDMPATVKWANPKLADALTEVEVQIDEEAGLKTVLPPHLTPFLKFADMADLCFKAADEITAGNMFFTPILARGMHALKKLLQGPLADHQAAQEVYNMIISNPFVFVEEIVHDHTQKAPPQNAH